MMLKKLFCFVAVVVLTACAVGSPFKWNDARRIQPGMSKEQVVGILGKPMQVSTTNDLTTYVWVQVDQFTMASKSLRIDFKDDKAVSVPTIPAEFKD